MNPLERSVRGLRSRMRREECDVGVLDAHAAHSVGRNHRWYFSQESLQGSWHVKEDPSCGRRQELRSASVRQLSATFRDAKEARLRIPRTIRPSCSSC